MRLEHFPATVRSAKSNLNEAVRPFAQLTIDTLADIDDRLREMEAGLTPVFPEALRSRLHKAVSQAISSLHNYSNWLRHQLKNMQAAFALGPNIYQWYLTNVALIPYTVDDLLAQGQQAWNRAVSWDLLEHNRTTGLSPIPMFNSSEHHVHPPLLTAN